MGGLRTCWLLFVSSQKMMSGPTSIDAVKKKIRVLQEQAEEAVERAERLQKEVEKERKAKEEVRFFSIILGVGVEGV